MIESIEVRNFQIHKRTKIDFVPGINIISGTSDNGKSSIIRAFRWVLENRPQGFSFKRWGTPDKVITAVDIIVDEESISRKRGSVKNEYVFQDSTYKALRTDVPDPIKEHLEILPFNIQMQNDKVFLFQDSDSNVAKLINDVSGISVIDDILKESNRRLRELNSEEKILKDMVKDKQTQMITNKAFVTLKKKMKAIKSKIEYLQGIEEELEELEECLISYRELKARKKKLPDIDALEETIDRMSHLVNVIQHDQKNVETISEFIGLLEIKKTIPDKKLNSILVRIERLEEKSSKLESLIADEESLDEELEQMVYLTKTKKENKFRLKSTNEKLLEVKEECGACPVCEKEW